MNALRNGSTVAVAVTLFLAMANAQAPAADCLAADPLAADPLAAWRSGVEVHPVSTTPGRHTIHAYYLASPESPDGKHVLFYASAQEDGQLGELCLIDRRSGAEKVLARDIHTEDAHRAACQQWLEGGRLAAYHEVRGSQWRVVVVDIASGQKRVVARDRQVGFGDPKAAVLPLYGCHWNPGAHRDLELLDANSGELRTAVTIASVAEHYGDWLKSEFGNKATSIFFPVLSPDSRRVFFKIAAGSGGNEFRSKAASQRQGLVVFDLQRGDFLMLNPKWGHPAWHPDSNRILEVGNIFYDANRGGEVIRLPDLPRLRGSHPSVSPDGSLYVTDGLLDEVGGPAGQWGIVVGDTRGGAGRYQVLHRFDNSGGAKSWRRNHPHPVFSGDARRIYFNVNAGDWTQLYVAECAAPAAP
jgi:hypothetical protein